MNRISLVLIAFLANSPLAAQSLELPLDAPSVVIELSNADVEVLADPTAKPVLRAAAAEDEPAPEVLLDWVAEGGILTIRRPAGETLRLKVEIVVGAEQRLRLSGRDLSVVAREAQYEGVTAPPGFRFDLESSELDLEGGRGVVLEARESSVFLSGTRGQLTVTLDSGSAQIRGHRGSLKLEAAGTEVALIDCEGKVEPRLHGGSLDVRQGTGQLTAKADDAVLLFEGWRGQLTLTGTGTTVDARDAAEPGPWKVEGEDLQVTLERIAGPVTANFNGGRLEAREMGGILTVVASNRADVELTGLAQTANLKLTDAATAEVTDVSGDLVAEIEDSQLRADGIARLKLTGTRSQIQASGVMKLLRLQVSDSELDLDLATLAQHTSWKLSGTGRAAVRLPTPCRVKIDGPRDLLGDQIEVSGCELRVPGQPAQSKKEWFIYGDRKPVILTVNLGEDFELEVEGLP